MEAPESGRSPTAQSKRNKAKSRLSRTESKTKPLEASSDRDSTNTKARRRSDKLKALSEPTTCTATKFTYSRRHFYVNADQLSSSVPHANTIFLEFRSLGPPPADIGQPGDVWIDTTPNSYAIYAKTLLIWVRWSGRYIENGSLIRHPYFPLLCLWCTMKEVVWMPAKRIEADLLKQYRERDGLHSQAASVAVEDLLAAGSSTPKRKRKKVGTRGKQAGDAQKLVSDIDDETTESPNESKEVTDTPIDQSLAVVQSAGNGDTCRDIPSSPVPGSPITQPSQQISDSDHQLKVIPPARLDPLQMMPSDPALPIPPEPSNPVHSEGEHASDTTTSPPASPTAQTASCSRLSLSCRSSKDTGTESISEPTLRLVPVTVWPESVSSQAPWSFTCQATEHSTISSPLVSAQRFEQSDQKGGSAWCKTRDSSPNRSCFELPAVLSPLKEFDVSPTSYPVLSDDDPSISLSCTSSQGFVSPTTAVTVPSDHSLLLSDALSKAPRDKKYAPTGILTDRTQKERTADMDINSKLLALEAQTTAFRLENDNLRAQNRLLAEEYTKIRAEKSSVATARTVDELRDIFIASIPKDNISDNFADNAVDFIRDVMQGVSDVLVSRKVIGSHPNGLNQIITELGNLSNTKIYPAACSRPRESIDIDGDRVNVPARKRPRLTAEADGIHFNPPSIEPIPDPLTTLAINYLDGGEVSSATDSLEPGRADNIDGKEPSKLNNPRGRNIIREDLLDILYHHAQGDKIYCRLCHIRQQLHDASYPATSFAPDESIESLISHSEIEHTAACEALIKSSPEELAAIREMMEAQGEGDEDDDNEDMVNVGVS